MVTSSASSSELLELRRTAEVSTAAQKLELYIRLFYGRSTAARLRDRLESRVDPELNATFGSIDFDRLKVEQEERVEQLESYLSRFVQPAWSFLSPEQRRGLVDRYCDSPEFWRFSGRNLIENFCLFAYPLLIGEGEARTAELLGLLGALAGISNDPRAPSPWEGHADSTSSADFPRAIAVESFITQFWLLNRSGGVLSKDDLAGEPEVRTGVFKVSIAIFSDRSAIVRSRPLENLEDRS